MAADKGQAAPVPQVMPNQPAQLATSDQPSDTIQFVKPVVPKTSGLRTSTASFSISPSLRGMDTKSMTIFSRSAISALCAWLFARGIYLADTHLALPTQVMCFSGAGLQKPFLPLLSPFFFSEPESSQCSFLKQTFSL